MKRIPIIVILLCATLLGSAQNVIEEKTRINIMMLEQSDMTALNREANRLATKHERREFVVETLKRQAESSQADLMLLLREMERDGMVDDIRQLWIANAISCNASEKAIEVISQRSDIMSVNKSEMVYCNSLPEMSVQPRNISRGLADHVAKINADQVWELGYTGQGVLVAVVDTGIDTAHLDLAGRMWDGGDEFPNHGYDVYEHDYDPSDQRGHGTKVAGIVCGMGMAGTQTGVAPDATVMNVKVFGNDVAGSPDAVFTDKSATTCLRQA